MRLVKQTKQTRGILIAHPRDRVKARARETKGEIWTRQGQSGRLSWRPTPERHSYQTAFLLLFFHPFVQHLFSSTSIEDSQPTVSHSFPT